MKRLSLYFLSCVAVAACSGNNPTQPTMGASAVEAPAFTKSTQPAYTCASADVTLGSLVTYVRNSTHVQAPATETALLAPLSTAHQALVATPCDKQGALAAMAAFDAAVDANARSVSATQAFMFHVLSSRVINTIKLVP
jgi:hypothetical protein